MIIFFDTNALIDLIETKKLKDYSLCNGLQLVTFEKCIYEYKNGIKSKFIDKQFMIDSISGTDRNTKAYEIIKLSLDRLKPNENNLKLLLEEIRTYNLYWEFGISQELQHLSVSEMQKRKYDLSKNTNDDNIIDIKQLYMTIKSIYNTYSLSIDHFFDKSNIKVILYEELFNSSMSSLREWFEECYLPTEDIEIVFAAHIGQSDFFVTNDKNIIRKSLTLGSNHIMCFITTDELDDKINKFTSTGLIDKTQSV